MIAIRNNSTEIALMLIEAGADVELALTAGKYAGQSPRSLALEKNNVEVLRALDAGHHFTR